MFAALIHALREGSDAARLAADAASARRLRADFFLSRLLRLGRMPGYNAPRRVRFKNGLWVNYRLNRGDVQSLREVLVEESYACELPAAPRTVLDLGANIGLTSVWFARLNRGNPAGDDRPPFLLAVEPDTGNAQMAAMNFRDNQVSGDLVCAAVAQQPGQAWFAARTESNLGCLTVGAGGVGRQRVPLVGIRDLLARFPEGWADLVKMDIEGSEADLLGHDTDWLARTGALLVEWHDDRADSQPLIQAVEAAGFRHQRVNVPQQDNLSLFVREPR